ncbi:basic secretory family protein [Micromonospora sp. HM5-17]|uniref:basic secretory family protein n=1 Tax=Micromonospora sp. HM5-17 TaxID=2487710 RepID=UPI001F28DAED|nr:basic secretory family protein [Micromonospora sp. HM5-17]
MVTAVPVTAYPLPGYGPSGAVRRPRRDARLWPWVSLGMVLALLCCGAPVVGGVLAFDRFAPAPGTGAGSGAPSPKPGDPPTVERDWLGERVTELLARQASALLAGDESGYLAVAEPNSPMARDLRRQFRTLRAMKVTRWQPEMRGKLVRLHEPGEWRSEIRIRHCFVLPECEPIEISLGLRWRNAAGQLRLINVEEPAGYGDRPRPWETDELVASVGERVLVAAPRAFRDRLPELLREGEQAARVADRYAADGSPPDRYRIFYAGPNEWNRWYGGDRAEWTAGYAVSLGAGQYDVVLNSTSLRDGDHGELLRHELTHAASLSGTTRTDGDAWWLVEGLAENAAAAGRPVSRYASLPLVERLVDGGWNGELDDVMPTGNAPDWRVGAAYGVGFLAVRHLTDRFGEAQVLRFFALVVHDGRSEEDAAREAFGADWSTLHDECVAYVRKTAT